MKSVKIKKICLVISSLQCGGAERVITLLANAWVNQKVDVTIITFMNANDDFYELDSRVKRLWVHKKLKSGGALNAISSNFRRVKFLKSSIVSENPDCVISFLAATNILTLAATLRLKLPVFVSERTDPRHYSIGRIRERLRNMLYPLASGVIVQTESVAHWFVRKNPRMKISVVPNPARPFTKSSLILNVPENGKKTVVAMGRLTEEKGFDILIAAFARCIEQGMNWRLVILGAGPLLDELKQCAASLNVSSHVIFEGMVSNPDDILKSADMFVLSSIAEGFPNALLEAMCCGLPVVSFDCDSGPADMIDDGVNGVLVTELNDMALSSAMIALMVNEGLRKRLADQALQANDKFSMTKILEKWNAIIASAFIEN